MNPQDLLMQAAGIEPAKPKAKAKKAPSKRARKPKAPAVPSLGGRTSAWSPEIPSKRPRIETLKWIAGRAAGSKGKKFGFEIVEGMRLLGYEVESKRVPYTYTNRRTGESEQRTMDVYTFSAPRFTVTPARTTKTVEAEIKNKYSELPGPFNTWFYKHDGKDRARRFIDAMPKAWREWMDAPAAKRRQLDQARAATKASPGAVKALRGALEQLTDERVPAVTDWILQSWDRMVRSVPKSHAAYKKALEEYQALSFRERRRRDIPSWRLNDYPKAVQAQIGRTFDDSKREYNYVVKPDYSPEAMRPAAKAEALAMRDEFITKNLAKVSRLLAHDTLVGLDAKYQGQYYGGEMTFRFGDGARFTVRNKTVAKTSTLGNPFLQFPTTFHDIVTPQGKKKKSASEAQMLRAFAAKG